MAEVQPGAQDPAALKAIARHAEAIATVRAFAVRSEALRVVLLLDLGDEQAPAMLDGERGARPDRRGRAVRGPRGDAGAGAATGAARDPARAVLGAEGRPDHGRAG